METWHTMLALVTLVGAGAVPLADTDASGAPTETEGTQIELSASDVHHVHIAGFDMEPSSLTIEAGDTVVWHNHDGATHTATDDGGAWDTGFLSEGETASITFDEVADYTYHCEVHPSTMQGFELHVVEANAEPVVTVDQPTEGANLEGVVNVQGTASDPDGTVEQVEVRIDDGDWRTAEGTGDWSLTWDTRTVQDGEHTIHARAFDGDTYGPVETVNVTTDNAVPDLSVEAIATEQSPGQARIDVTVANRGDAASSATSLTVRYEAPRGQGVVGQPELAALDAGEQTEVVVSWDTTNKVGEFELTARADPDDEVEDPFPDNDVRQETVCVPDAEGLTCHVGGTEVPP